MGDLSTRTDTVPFTDIYVDEAIVERVSEVLRSTRYVKGDRLEAFEEGFAELCGTDHAVGVSSGTDALLLALKASDVGPGDEVFVPAHTFFATASPVFEVGATPVLVDVEPDHYTLDPADLERKVERANDPAAVVPVHLYGQPAAMDRIRSVAERHDLTVVEDACQAHAAEYRGERAGGMGDVGCFSFYPSKNMTVAGDGGMLVTDDGETARRARMLRNHGRDEAGVHRVVGLNHRLDEVSAAVGLEQLEHVEEWGRKRRALADRYREFLSDVPEVTVPAERPDATHVYHLYVVRAEERDALREHLSERGIETGIHYPNPLHRQPAIRERVEAGEARANGLERAEAVTGRILSLPMSPRHGEEEVRYVTETVGDFYTR